MASCNLGSRSRAAVLGLLCVCAVAVQAGRSVAQDIVIGDQFDGGPVVGDDGSGGMPCDGEMPCDYGYGDGDGYDGGDGYMPCDGCPPCEPLCEPKRRCSGWFGAEYLRWKLDGNRLPPLVTAGPSNLPLADVAQLDDPSTVILSGHETANDDWRDGYRFVGGFWFDCCHTCGIGVDYFDIGDDDYNFTSPQDPSIVTGRPFFNTELDEDDAELVSVPNELDGTAQVKSNDEFKGAGLTLNKSMWRCCNQCEGVTCGVTLLNGYRYYKYDTNLNITERLTVLPGTTSPLVPGTTFRVQDSFRTHNEFNGGELGLQLYKQRCWWWLDGMAKVAMGMQHRTVTINGRTFIDVPGGGTSLASGGLLTSELTNIGRYDDSDFVFIPEFRLGIGACVCKCCSVRAGYNCIIWGDVARASSHLPPGLQVDPRNLPPTQAGGGGDPEFPGIRGSQLVAHGLDASIMWQW
jgi:Putative beta barrel porin-7 (BBP7)